MWEEELTSASQRDALVDELYWTQQQLDEALCENDADAVETCRRTLGVLEEVRLRHTREGGGHGTTNSTGGGAA
jgi:hypothetical protein